jgi:phosphohistidine phosphatase
MQLYIVRHAVAERGDRSVPDAARALTPRGRARFRREVQGLRRLGVRFDRVYHSPKLRAIETADLLAPLLRGETAVTPHLSRAPTPALLATVQGDSAAVVGHEPWLGALAAWLVTGDRRRGAQFSMKKGGVLLLEGDLRPGAMRLAAALPPKVLRRAGRG